MNEALLLDDATQDLYEGLSSNLFAFDGTRQTIVTAPLDSVLKGTILKVVVAVCEEQKIPIEFKFPNLKHLEEWEGAFITSRSTLCSHIWSKSICSVDSNPPHPFVTVHA